MATLYIIVSLLVVTLKSLRRENHVARWIMKLYCDRLFCSIIVFFREALKESCLTCSQHGIRWQSLWIGRTCVHESTKYFPVARILSRSRQLNIKQTIQTILKRRQLRGACKKTHDASYKILPGMASDCDKHLYVRIPAKLLITHDYFNFIVPTWPFWSAFTFDLLFSPTRTWSHMDAFFSESSRATQQLRKLNVWLPATGKYPKVICGFMNVCAPRLPSKTKILWKLCVISIYLVCCQGQEKPPVPTYAVLTASQTWLF